MGSTFHMLCCLQPTLPLRLQGYGKHLSPVRTTVMENLFSAARDRMHNSYFTVAISLMGYPDLFFFFCIIAKQAVFVCVWVVCILTLKAPITTAADDIHKYFFIVFQIK